jgi:hypothetical protein
MGYTERAIYQLVGNRGRDTDLQATHVCPVKHLPPTHNVSAMLNFGTSLGAITKCTVAQKTYQITYSFEHEMPHPEANLDIKCEVYFRDHIDGRRQHFSFPAPIDSLFTTDSSGDRLTPASKLLLENMLNGLVYEDRFTVLWGKRIQKG